MSTEERDDAQAQQEQSQPQQQQQAQPQPRPKKVIPTVRREGAEQQDGTPYNQGYNRPEGNYERRNYNRPQQGGGYNRPYNNNYGDRQNNRQGYGYQGGGYNRPARGNYGNMNQGGGYGNNRTRNAAMELMRRGLWEGEPVSSVLVTASRVIARLPGGQDTNSADDFFITEARTSTFGTTNEYFPYSE